MKRVMEGASGWLFGLAVTLLLISIWGRAIVIDTDALAENLSPLSQSVAVVDQFADWLGSELTGAGVDAALAEEAVKSTLAGSVVDDALDDLVLEVVFSAATADPGGASVDVASILAPAVPEIAVSLTSAGVPVTEGQVEEVVEGLDPLVIIEPGQAPPVGPESPIATRLGTATVLALVVMVVAGSISITAASDRIGAARKLLIRVALSGLTFGLLLKLGSWILDPGRGRAPVSQALSGLAEAKWLVPVSVAGLAAALAGLTWLIRRGVKPEATIPEPYGEPIRQPG